MMLSLVRVDQGIRALLPALLTLFLLLLTLLPVGLGHLHYLMPTLPLMAVVYWSLRTPVQFPLWLAFTFGLLADLLDLTPLGLQALLYVLVPLAVSGRRRTLAIRSFPVLWLIFALAALAQLTLFWLAAVASAGMAPATGWLYLRGLVSILVFPLVARLLLAPASRLVESHV